MIRNRRVPGFGGVRLLAMWAVLAALLVTTGLEPSLSGAHPVPTLNGRLFAHPPGAMTTPFPPLLGAPLGGHSCFVVSAQRCGENSYTCLIAAGGCPENAPRIPILESIPALPR